MAINFKLGPKREVGDEDDMRRGWVGWHDGMPAEEVYRRNRGLWRLGRRAGEERYATFSVDGVVRYVFELTGSKIEEIPSLTAGVKPRKAIVGRPLSPGHPAYDALIDRQVDGYRNPVSYLPDDPDDPTAPDMSAYVAELVGETLMTVADRHPNTIVRVTENRALVRTLTGDNWVPLRPLQAIADRVYAGEEVTVPTRGRSAFHMAVLATRPELDYALDPRRVWLKDAVGTFDAEYADLFPEEDPGAVSEGRMRYRRHRVRERSPILRRLKIGAALATTGALKCETCGFDFADRYGDLGAGYIECHHRDALAAVGERETSTEDLALLCANCHRMIHRTRPMVSVEELRAFLR